MNNSTQKPRNEQEKYGLDQVNVSFLESSSSSSKKDHLPLVLTPRWDDSSDFLQNFLRSNRDWVDKQILRYGAVLIRGFQLDDSPEVERAIQALQPNLCGDYRGTSPRKLMAGTQHVFSAAEVPVHFPIAQHLEMSFLAKPPRQLYFGCIQAPENAGGGETALCDFRRVYQELSPNLREKLRTKKLKYSRTHSKEGEYWTYDVAAMLGWKDMFETDDPKEVERICREEDSAPVQWEDGCNIFHQEWIDEPFQVHPDTNEHVWFNHSQVFHWTTFPAEIWFAFERVRDIRLLIHWFFVAIYCWIKYGLFGYHMGLESTFGDGTPISVAEMREIRQVIHNNMVFSRWRKGDIICIDNFSVSHGRQPTYDKGRKIVVAWSNPYPKSGKPVAVERSTVEESHDTVKSLEVTELGKLNANDIPDLAALSPGNSPNSTLTSSEAEELQDAFHRLTFELQHSTEAINKRKSLHTRCSSAPSFGSLLDSDFWKEKEE